MIRESNLSICFGYLDSPAGERKFGYRSAVNSFFFFFFFFLQAELCWYHYYFYFFFFIFFLQAELCWYHYYLCEVADVVHNDNNNGWRFVTKPTTLNANNVKFKGFEKKVREKSRECHNPKPQSFPDTKRKRKRTKSNKRKSKDWPLIPCS